MSTDAITTALNALEVHSLVELLASDLCKERGIPPEIAIAISRYFETRDVLNIGTLSRNLHERANAILYHNVVINDVSSHRSKRSATLLLRTLVTSTTAASCIRRLSFVGDPLDEWRKQIGYKWESCEEAFRTKTPQQFSFDFSAFKSGEFDLYNRKACLFRDRNTTSSAGLTLPWLCIDFITLATGLQELRIRSDYFRYPEFEVALREFVNTGGLNSLQRSDFCADLVRGPCRHMSVSQHWDRGLLAPFFAPNIDSITTVLTLGQGGRSQLRTSTVTRLCLNHYQTQQIDLNGLLAATPRLRYLEYNAWVDFGWYPNPHKLDRRHTVGLEPLFDALEHIKDTITELVTTVAFTEDSPHFQKDQVMNHKPIFTQSKGVSKLKHLHTLSIPWTYLLGEEPKGEPVKAWNMMLPPSLRRITLTDHLNDIVAGDRWTDEALMPVISNLLNWLKKTEQPQDTSKFGLLLKSSATEFNAPARQTLSQLCQSHDVLLSIEKTTPDRPKSPPRPSIPRGRGRGRGMGHHTARGGDRGRGTG